MSLFYAAEIEGLRNPLDTTDPERVLFVHGDTTALSLPASLAGSTVLAILDSNDPGEGWSSDLRKPIGSGGAQALHLLDTTDGALGKILLFDPAETTWDITSAVVADSAGSLVVSGPSQPALGFYWIEEECIEVTAVALVPMGGGNSALTFYGGSGASLAVRMTISTAGLVNVVGAFTIGGDVGFYGTGATAKQTVVGVVGGNTALNSLLTALATIGLITNNSTP